MASTDGFVAIPKHILQNSELTPEGIVLYAHLLHFDRGPKGLGCIAKRSTLSKMSGLTLHKLRKAILNLEENGIVSVIRRRNSLTDRIRINPDCRPKLSTPKKSGSSSTEAKSKSRTTYETKKLNPSTIKTNNTTQVNKIESHNTSNIITEEKIEESITDNPTEIVSKTNVESTRVLNLGPMLLSRTKAVREKIRGSIREASYEEYFKDISVFSECNRILTLYTPKGSLYAEFISNKFCSDLKSTFGKHVRVIT